MPVRTSSIPNKRMHRSSTNNISHPHRSPLVPNRWKPYEGHLESSKGDSDERHGDSYISQRQSRQRTFETNHRPIRVYNPWASVHRVVCHVRDSTTPNTHFLSEHHIDQCESRDIHARGKRNQRQLSEWEEHLPWRFDTTGERRANEKCRSDWLGDRVSRLALE